MNVTDISKINSLLQKLPKGALYFASWLNEQGISYSLQQTYRESNWFSHFAQGVLFRSGETPTLYAALSCANTQLNKQFRIGALSALDLKGFSHYLPLGRQTIVVYYPHNEWFPNWLKKHDWGVNVQKCSTKISETQTGITTINENGFEVLISSPERAFMECLDLSPKYYDLTDLYYVMEMLTNLRLELVQKLLEKCKSIKVKRLFLYMAEKAQHQWFNGIDFSKIDLGKGKRAIVKNGVFNSKYQITIPKELADYE
jgi:hypothetical protein